MRPTRMTALVTYRARFLTLLQAAALLGVAADTLARWARDGHVPAYKTPGGRWRFVEEDLILALRRARTHEERR